MTVSSDLYRSMCSASNRAFIGSASLPAVAAQFCHIGLYNQSTSTRIIALDAIEYAANIAATDGVIELGFDTTAAGANFINFTQCASVNSGNIAVPATNSQGRTCTRSNAAAPAGALVLANIITPLTATSATATLGARRIEFKNPIIIPPDALFYLRHGTVNLSLRATFEFRELTA